MFYQYGVGATTTSDGREMSVLVMFFDTHAVILDSFVPVKNDDMLLCVIFNTAVSIGNV